MYMAHGKNFTVTHFTSLQNKITSHKSLQFTPHHYTSHHFSSPHITTLHITSVHPTSLHFTSLHFTSLHLFTLNPHLNSLACNYILNPLSKCVQFTGKGNHQNVDTKIYNNPRPILRKCSGWRTTSLSFTKLSTELTAMMISNKCGMRKVRGIQLPQTVGKMTESTSVQ